MIASFFSWFWGTLFFVVAFGALMNPPPYIAIALLFSFMGLVLLPPTKRLAQQKFNWQINGGELATIAIIVSSILDLFNRATDRNRSFSICRRKTT